MVHKGEIWKHATKIWPNGDKTGRQALWLCLLAVVTRVVKKNQPHLGHLTIGTDGRLRGIEFLRGGGVNIGESRTYHTTMCVRFASYI